MQRLYSLLSGRRSISKLTSVLRKLYLGVQGTRIARRRFNELRRIIRRYGIEGHPEGNVIIMTIDCLRYRNMSFTGYKRKTTPFIDSYFKVKLRAFSASPHTYSSVPSILTGLYPHNHGAFIGGEVKNMDKLQWFKPLRSDVATILEIMTVLGYETAFITTVYPSLMPLKGHLHKYVLESHLERASIVLDKALRIIRRAVKAGKRFMLYIHLGDLHEPLNPPKDFRNFFGEVKPLPYLERWAYMRPEEQRGKKFDEYKYNKILLYDNTLRYVDSAIEKFFSKLRETESRDTLIILTADHGEEFWEHANIEAKYFYDPRGVYGVGHGHNVFNEIIEIPLLIHGSDAGKVMRLGDKPASNVDIVPTILDWLGLNYNPRAFDGFSLYSGSVPAERHIIAEAVAYGYEKKALIKGMYKLLYSRGDKVSWVFNLNRDPYEQEPVAEGEPVNSMLVELKKILTRDMLRRRARIS